MSGPSSTPQPNARRADLVLEGGGVKGIGLVGAVLELADAGYAFPRVAGTSAGAIVASLVAAMQQAGRDLHELEGIMRGLDYSKFKDGPWWERHTGLFGEAAELLVHDGMYRGEYLREWLGNELADLGVQTFADLRIDDDPDTSLPEGQRYRLVAHASDLSRRALMRLPWDYPKYGLDPNRELVVDAVRASMSIPFFFRPVELTCGDGSGSCTLVDGGLLSNYPITVFDRTDGKPARWPTWGVKLSAKPDVHTQLTEADSDAVGVLLGCVETLMGRWDHYHLDDELVGDRTIFVDTFGLSSVDFGLTQDDQQRLYDNGRQAAAQFLAAQRVISLPDQASVQSTSAAVITP